MVGLPKFKSMAPAGKAFGEKSCMWRRGLPKELNTQWNVGSAVKRSDDKKKGGGWLFGEKCEAGSRRSYVTVDLLQERAHSHSLWRISFSF